jgi:hypothetical protein
MSTSGQNMVVGSPTATYYSQDFGMTWTKSNFIAGNIFDMTSDSTGQFVVVSSGEYFYSQVYRSSDYGKTWVLCYHDHDVIKVASSGNGQFLYTTSSSHGGYKSTDGGTTWNVLPSLLPLGALQYAGIVCDSTGQYITIATSPGSIFLSEDYGVTFNELHAATFNAVQAMQPIIAPTIQPSATLPPPTTSVIPKEQNSSDSIALSSSIEIRDADEMFGSYMSINTDATGQYVVVLELHDGVFTSSDFGKSYQWDNVDNKNWKFGTFNDIDIAANSPKFTLVATAKGIYYSVNSGIALVQANAPDTIGWSLVALSSTGQYAYAIPNSFYANVRIYSSMDHMKTFTLLPNSPMGRFMDLVISYSGRYIFAMTNSTLYTSSDYGKNWAQRKFPFKSDFTPSLSCSSTGQFVGIVTIDFPPYLSTDYGSTWTQLKTPSDVNEWDSISICATGGQHITLLSHGSNLERLWCNVCTDFFRE